MLLDEWMFGVTVVVVERNPWEGQTITHQHESIRKRIDPNLLITRNTVIFIVIVV